jgi:hypothetical protein
MRCLLILAALLVCGAPAFAQHTYYVDSTSGADTNTSTQAQSKSTPWAHLPCMANATSNAAAYSAVAGDQFILKGGASWTNASFPCHWTKNGTSANPIYVGVDQTWYTGASWNRPIFDAGGTDIGGAGGCTSGLGKNWMLYFDTVTYVTFDWIEMKGLYWNNNQQGSCFETVGFAIGNASDHIIINHSYLHGWTHGTSAGTTDTGSGAMIASYNTTPDCGNCIFENSVMDNSDSVDGATCPTGGSLCSGGGVSSWSAINDIFYDVVEAIDTTNRLSTDTVTVAGNNISNLMESFTTPSQGSSAPHPNCIETLDTGTYYIHDNYIHNIYNCEGGQVGNPGEVDYVWNNVWDMGATGVAGVNGPQVPQSTSGSKSLFFWNNTVRWAAGCINVGGHSTTYTGTFAVQNNHCINDAQTTVAGTTPGGATITNNLGMTNATATTQGYTSSESWPFSPTAGTNSTVGAGTNLTSSWPAGFNTTDFAYICTEQTVSGVVESVCTPTRGYSRPTGSTAWDIGAYEFSIPQAATPTFSPVAGSYSGTQSVTLSTTSSGAIICYNTTGSPATNGTTGCTTGTLYSGAISVTSSEAIYAVAGGTGFTDSAVGSAAYTITGGAANSVIGGGAVISGGTVIH